MKTIRTSQISLLHLSVTVLLLAILTLAAGCMRDVFSEEPGTERSTEAEVTFTLALPDMMPPRGGDMRMGLDEDALQNLYVIATKIEGGEEKVKHYFLFSDNIHKIEIQPTSNPKDRYWLVRMHLPSDDYHRIVIVANAPRGKSDNLIPFDPMIPQIILRYNLFNPIISSLYDNNDELIPTTYNGLKRMELRSVDYPYHAQGAHSPTSDPYFHTFPDYKSQFFNKGSYMMPMYGELCGTGTNGIRLEEGVSRVLCDKTNPVSMRRMMARVDVINEDPGFELEKIHLVGFPTSGNAYADLAHPDVPVHHDNYDRDMNFRDITPDVATPQKIQNIYVYESPNPITPPDNGWNGNTHMRIVVQGKYKGQTTYYPMDFVHDGNHGVTKGTPMHILRNHLYRFTITSVKQKGLDTYEDAMRESSVSYGAYTNNATNGIATLHAVDLDYIHSVFDNVDYIDVSHRRVVMLAPQNTQTISIKASKDFKVYCFNPDGSVPSFHDALTIDQENFSAGAHDVKITLRQFAFNRTLGYLEIRLEGSPLRERIDVYRVGPLPIERMAEFNLVGNNTYSCSNLSSIPGGATSPWDQSLGFTTSHATNQSGYYNHYVLSSGSDPIYDPDDKFLYRKFYGTSLEPYQDGAPALWHAILPSDVNANGTYKELVLCSTSQEISSSTYSFDNTHNTTYALRYHKVEDSDPDAYSYVVHSTQPVRDNYGMCAFRYRYLGSFAADNNTDSKLEISCVWVGYMNPLPDINTIKSDSWWNAHRSKTIVRYLPACGFIDQAAPPTAPGEKKGVLKLRGNTGYYHVGVDTSVGRLMHVEITKNKCKFVHNDSGNNDDAFCLRLFKNS